MQTNTHLPLSKSSIIQSMSLATFGLIEEGDTVHDKMSGCMHSEESNIG